jgi:hypothetical protein
VGFLAGPVRARREPFTKLRVVFQAYSNPDFRRQPQITHLFEDLHGIFWLFSGQSSSDAGQITGKTPLNSVSLNPDVIFLTGNLLARTFRTWAGTTPIVATMSDPLETGMVQSLARPGGYLTGVSEDAGIEIWGKRVELLKEAVPSMATLAYVGVQLTRMGATRQAVESAAQRLGLSVIGVSVEEPSPAEYRRLSAALVEQRPDAIAVAYGFGGGIVELAAKQRLPAIYSSRAYVDIGGLMAYGSDRAETARQSANDVHQILGGVKPGEIPNLSGHQIRTRDEPEDRKRARPHPISIAIRPRRRSHRVRRSELPHAPR